MSATLFDYISQNNLPSGKHSVVIDDVSLDIELVKIEGDYTFTNGMTVGDTVADTHMLVLMVVGKLTVRENATLQPQVRKKGFFVYATEGIENNGTISMTARGAKAKGDNLKIVKDINGVVQSLSAEGGNGASKNKLLKQSSPMAISGNNGSKSSSISCGGGGSGGVMISSLSASDYAESGLGSAGTSYSGGAGSGGAVANLTTKTSSNAGSNGGSGSSGVVTNTRESGAGGGAGNSGGAGASSGKSGSNGTGGLLILFGKEIINNGTLVSTGSNGGDAGIGVKYGAGGGGSGGGTIVLIYEEKLSEGTINVKGGSGGSGGVSYGKSTGGAGGDGSYTFVQVKGIKNRILTRAKNNFYSIRESEPLTQLPSNSVDNFIKYGSSSIEHFNVINTNKNYILSKNESENADGLWVQEIDRKPLSIKFE